MTKYIPIGATPGPYYVDDVTTRAGMNALHWLRWADIHRDTESQWTNEERDQVMNARAKQAAIILSLD